MADPETMRPGYREVPPPEALRHVVACLWVRVTGAAGEVHVVPDGCADVVWQRGTGVTVAGPDTSAKLVTRDAEDVTVGMRFRPGAGGGMLGAPLDQVRDMSVDVAEIDRTFVLDGDLPPYEVVARFLAAVEGRQTDPLVAEAALMVEDQPVASVARALWVSERQLRRRFHAAVGYGPKTLARVLRFHRFVDAIDGGRSDLAAIAADAGYADQAHLTREATRLAGLPPAAFQAARKISTARTVA